MAVTYRTLNGFPRGKWTNGFFYGETKLRCTWDNVDDLLTEIDASPAWPATYAWGPTTALAYEASVDPWAKQNNDNTSLTDYSHAVVTVKYTTKGPQWVANHGSIRDEFGASAMSIPVDTAHMTWADGTRVNHNTISNPTLYLATYRVTWEQVVTPNPAYWAALIGNTLVGCTNSNVVTAFNSSRSFPIGTLRFVPPYITTTYGVGTVARTTVKMELQYHPGGWNKCYNSNTNTWETVTMKNGAAFTPYTPAVFPSR